MAAAKRLSQCGGSRKYRLNYMDPVGYDKGLGLYFKNNETSLKSFQAVEFAK